MDSRKVNQDFPDNKFNKIQFDFFQQMMMNFLWAFDFPFIFTTFDLIIELRGGIFIGNSVSF
jgi:hypothetical protein